MNRKVIEEVERLQSKISDTKRQKSKLEGNLEEQYKTLQKTYGVKTIEQAEEKIRKLSKEKKIAEDKAEGLFNTLQKKFKW